MDLLDPKSPVHTEATDEFLSYIDILVDGEFVEEEKDLMLEFRGSRNQRILHLSRQRAGGSIHHTKGDFS
jgi:anaerobic ribonucleoside-triphosphate reductase activating protein